MKIATWNINSIRIRLDILAQCISILKPDILCLQETKVEDALFPFEEVAKLGLPHVYFAGQKSYNGVAILSNLPLSDVHSMDILNNGEKRHIGAKLPNGTQIHNFYVPAGGDIPDINHNPKFKDKLAFVDAMHQWSKELPKKASCIIVGDFNIAPYEHDVWSHKQLLDVVSHTPIETEKLENLRKSLEWIDVARHFIPYEEKVYSWWSYRNRDWAASNRGRRLDHIWTTKDMKNKLASFHVFKEARSFEKTSDHVPVLLELT